MRRYLGESTAKKMHRLTLWRYMLAREGVPRRIHVLASREAGDVSCLLAMGVKPTEIYAYELDEEEREIAQKKFPSVNWGSDILCDMKPDHVALGAWLFGGERDLKRMAEGNLCDLVYLDLCSPLCLKSLELILSVAGRMHSYAADRTQHHWTAPATLAVTFLKGREFRNVPRSIGVAREVKGNTRDYRSLDKDQRHIWRNKLSQLLSGVSGSYDDLFRYVRAEYSDVPTSVLRIGIVTEALRLHGERGWEPSALLEYSSGRSPMQTIVFTKRAYPQDSYTCFGDFTLTRSLDRYGRPDDVVWKGNCEHPGPYPPDYRVLVRRETPNWEDVKRQAVEQKDVPWAGLLNVSCGTVGAWRAVATREARAARGKRCRAGSQRPQRCSGDFHV